MKIEKNYFYLMEFLCFTNCLTALCQAVDTEAAGQRGVKLHSSYLFHCTAVLLAGHNIGAHQCIPTRYNDQLQATHYEISMTNYYYYFFNVAVTGHRFVMPLVLSVSDSAPGFKARVDPVADPGFPVGGPWTPEAITFCKFCMSKRKNLDP